jgi:hypothetical protein
MFTVPSKYGKDWSEINKKSHEKIKRERLFTIGIMLFLLTIVTTIMLILHNC